MPMIAQIRLNLRFDAQDEYNCSLAGDNVDWVARGEKQPIFGSLCVLYSFFAIPIYTTVVKFFWRMRKGHYYKIMFYLGVMDIAMLFINSFVVGIQLIRGDVYCTFPKINWTVSMIGMFFFISSNTTCSLLAINRFIDLTSTSITSFVFEGNRTWWFHAPQFLYSLFCALFTPLFFFNSKYHVVLANPMISDKFEYYSYFHIANNMLNPTVTLCLYTAMACHVRRKHRKVNTSNKASNTATNRASNMLSLQSFVVITFHMTTCAAYELIQFIEMNDAFLYICHVTWMLTHGSPPIVYAICNPAIRLHLRNILLKKGGADLSITGEVTLVVRIPDRIA